jgi:hypothetical protein
MVRGIKMDKNGIVIGDARMLKRRPPHLPPPLLYSEYVWGLYKWAWLQEI